jgi:selenocysteine lyase/cysteine desulfurase
MRRRGFLHLAALHATSLAVAQNAGRYVRDRSPESVAADEDYWAEIRNAFTVDRNIINLNNGGVSPSPRIVQDAMRRYLEFSNTAPVHTMWRVLEPQIESVRRGLARAFGCDPEELAITRNASEALEICQLGLDLRAGDEVITTTQDYPRMITTWRQRERREGIVLKMIRFPVPPPSLDDLAERFERAITPRTRALLLCHMTNRTGQIFPARKICRMARERGIEVIVDGAHAFAHFPFQHQDLDCDYYGTSLHKWLLAPHGTGFLYVRKAKIPALWPLMAAPETLKDNIRKFEEIGTHPAANHNAISEALTFHESIGVERKAARLRYLRDRWAARLGRLPKVKILHSPDPAQSCGLGFLGLEGLNAAKVAEELWQKHGILAVPISSDEYSGLRITANLYTTLEEVDTFCSALEKILA